MILSQIVLIVKVFGGWSTSPKWINIAAGIGGILYVIALVGLSSNS